MSSCSSTQDRNARDKPMKTLLRSGLLAVAAPAKVPIPLSVAEQFAGSYYATGGAQEVLNRLDDLPPGPYLDLAADGTYQAAWRGCPGPRAMGSGNWSVKEAVLSLRPFEQWGDIDR